MIKCNFKNHYIKLKGSKIEVATEVSRILYECLKIFGEDEVDLFIKSAKDVYQEDKIKNQN